MKRGNKTPCPPASRQMQEFHPFSCQPVASRRLADQVLPPVQHTKLYVLIRKAFRAEEDARLKALKVKISFLLKMLVISILIHHPMSHPFRRLVGMLNKNFEA